MIARAIRFGRKDMDELREHCCEQMTKRVNHRCEQHPNVFDCADNLIYHSEQSDKYGIIVHDGGSSFILINYCPWCGTKLPEFTR
jgi:hypothetical protein